MLFSLSLLLLLSASYFFGRLSAGPPRFAVEQQSAVLDSAWKNFQRAQQQAMDLMRADDFYDDEISRAEAYRGLLYNLAGSIKSALVDPDNPRFVRAVDWSSKSGLENPDNSYYTARVSGASVYRIRGNRGSVASMVFQVVEGQPGVGDAGTSTHVSMLYGEQLQCDGEGNFEIYVASEPPPAGGNWLRLNERAGMILLRFSHSDWQSERAGWAYIEPLDVPAARPPLSESAMAEQLDLAARSLYDRTATWLHYAKKLSLLPANTLSAVRPSQGGLVGQYSAFGRWQLAEDELLLISVPPSAAPYQGIQLGNNWFVSLDYESHTASLTADQAYLSSDGLYHFVVSLSDPGVQNWLDPESHRSGLILMRWQGLPEPLAQQPRAEKLSWRQLRERLPADVFGFDAEARASQLAARREQVQRR